VTKAEDEAQRRADVARLMELPEFQRFADWLMFRLAPIDAPPAENLPDSVRAFRDGRRSVSIDVGRLLRAQNFKAWQRMEQEAELRRQAPKLQDSPDSSGHG
jgi:hypothetical protein